MVIVVRKKRSHRSTLSMKVDTFIVHLLTRSTLSKKDDTCIVYLLTRSTLSMKVDTFIVHLLTRSTICMKVDTFIVHQESLKKYLVHSSLCLKFFHLLARKPNLEKKIYSFKQILS